MILKELGKSGEKVSAVGIGTWQMDKSDNSQKVIQEGLRAGSNFVDTAEFYRNEEMVGEAISGMEDVFLATKVFPVHFSYDKVIRSCTRSLSKLKRKQIDLYQLHWPSSSVPIEETMRAMEKLVDDGKIRYIGVSNFSLEQMKEAQESMKKYEIVSNQVEYNPMVRYIEKDIMQYCEKEKISIIAYSPLKHGGALKSLSGNNVISEISKSQGATVAQVIIRWLISKKPVFAIPKTSRVERSIENIKSQEVELSEEQVRKIDEFVKKYSSISTRSKVGGLISFTSRLFR